MLVTIHNLPVHIRYSDIKNLLQSKCGFSEVILDNLVNEGKTKKVTVGLPQEEDAAILTRNINGLLYDGRQLYVKDVRQKTASDQPYHKTNAPADQPRSNYQESNYQQSNYQQSNYQQSNYQQSNYQQSNYQQTNNQQSNYQAQLQTPIGYPIQMNSLQDYQNYQAQGYQAMMAPMMDMPYYMQAQSAYMGYPGQGQMSATPQFPQFGQYDQSQNNYGKGNDQNDRSRQWDTNNRQQSSNQNRQRSPSPSQGRSRWDNETGTRNRSRSPQRRDRSGQRSPNRSERSSYGGRTDQGSSRNEAFSFGGQNSGNSNIQAGSNRIAHSPWESGPNSQNNIRDQLPIDKEPQARPNWERKAAPVMYNQGPSQNTWQRDNNSSVGNSSGNQEWNRSGSFQGASPMSGFRTQAYNDNQNRTQNAWKRPNTDFDQSQPKRSRFDQGSQPPQPSRWERPGNSGPSGQNQRQYQSGKNSNFRSGPAFGNKNQPWNNQRPTQPPRKNGNMAPQLSSKNSPNDIASYIRKDMANRNQACQDLLKKIKKVSPEIEADEDLGKILRKAIRGRLECLLVDSIGITPKQMTEKYRRKFCEASDKTLCNAIIKKAAEEKTAEASATDTEPKTEAGEADEAKPSAAPASGVQNKPAQSFKPLPTFKAPEDGKLPTYPNADKRVYKNIKQLQKAEHRDDDFYKGEMLAKYPREEEALVREVDTIIDIFKNVFENPDDEKEKPACDVILKGETFKELRRAIKLIVTKRILDIRTNLIVRVISHGRAPKKPDLENFMSRFDVVSMKKSKSKVPLYLVTCATYETYDHLLGMAEVTLGDINVTFRPFQLLGPGLSCRERMLKRGVDHAAERREMDLARKLLKTPGVKLDIGEVAVEDVDKKDMVDVDETAEEADEGDVGEEQETEEIEEGVDEEQAAEVQAAEDEINEEDFEEW